MREARVTSVSDICYRLHACMLSIAYTADAQAWPLKATTFLRKGHVQLSPIVSHVHGGMPAVNVPDTEGAERARSGTSSAPLVPCCKLGFFIAGNSSLVHFQASMVVWSVTESCPLLLGTRRIPRSRH